MAKVMMRKALGAFFVLVVSALQIYAEDLTVKIPFEFRVGSKSLPAGIYTLVFEKTNPKALMLRRQGDAAATRVPIVTRLAKHERTESGGQVVFDQFEHEHIIAELWIPGLDGFYLGGAQGEHSHLIVKGAR